MKVSAWSSGENPRMTKGLWVSSIRQVWRTCGFGYGRDGPGRMGAWEWEVVLCSLCLQRPGSFTPWMRLLNEAPLRNRGPGTSLGLHISQSDQEVMRQPGGDWDSLLPTAHLCHITAFLRVNQIKMRREKNRRVHWATWERPIVHEDWRWTP